MTPVSVVIPVKNRALMLELTLPSIAKQLPEGGEIVIADYGSSDGLMDVLKPYTAVNYVRVECDDDVVGPAKALNAGIKSAKNKVLILQGTEIRYKDDDLVETMITVVDANPHAWAFAHVIGLTDRGALGKDYVSPQNKRACWICSCVRKEHLEAVGGFDERFTKYGFEDQAIADQLIGYGLDLVFTRACVLHLEHERDMKGSDEMKRVYQSTYLPRRVVEPCTHVIPRKVECPHCRQGFYLSSESGVS